MPRVQTRSTLQPWHRPTRSTAITILATSTPTDIITPTLRQHVTRLRTCIRPVHTPISLRRTCLAIRATLDTPAASSRRHRQGGILATRPRSKAPPVRLPRLSTIRPRRAMVGSHPRARLAMPRLHRRCLGKGQLTMLRQALRLPRPQQLRVSNTMLVRDTSALWNVGEGRPRPRV